MELFIDLLRNNKKSQSRVIVGILFLTAFVFLIAIKIMDNNFVDFWGWFFAVTLVFLGIHHILGGAGFAFSRLFGKAIIHINEHFISIKSGLFEREQKFMWQDIKSMEYMANKYRVILNNDATTILNLSKIEYQLKSEVKDVLCKIAAEKGIKIS